MMGGWRPQAPEQVPYRVQAPQEGGEDRDVGTRDVLGVTGFSKPVTHPWSAVQGSSP